jgi:hypothetical protein
MEYFHDSRKFYWMALLKLISLGCIIRTRESLLVFFLIFKNCFGNLCVGNLEIYFSR